MMRYTDIEAARRLLLAALCGLGLALPAPDAAAGEFSFTWQLQPLSGTVYAMPGETVGWGYVLINDDPDHWLVTTVLDSDPFQYGVGDSSIFDFPVLAPLGQQTVDFNDGDDTGLFRFTWDDSVMLGASNSGDFRLSAEWWSGDPFSGGTFIANADVAYQSYTAVAGLAPVPAPLYLVVIGALAHGTVRCRLGPRRG